MEFVIYPSKLSFIGPFSYFPSFYLFSIHRYEDMNKSADLCQIILVHLI